MLERFRRVNICLAYQRWKLKHTTVCLCTSEWMNREHSEVKDKLHENYLHISLHRRGSSGGKKNREWVFFYCEINQRLSLESSSFRQIASLLLLSCIHNGILLNAKNSLIYALPITPRLTLFFDVCNKNLSSSCWQMKLSLALLPDAHKKS